MPDRDRYEKAMTEIAAAERRIKELRVFVRLYDELGGSPAPADNPASLSENEPDQTAGVAPPAMSLPLEPRRGRVPPTHRAPPISAELFESTLIKVFDDVGRPLLRHEILDELAKRGVVIGGNKAINTLSTKLYRARDVVEVVPGVGYWPVDRPLPEAHDAPRGAEEEDADADTALRANGMSRDEPYADIFN